MYFSIIIYYDILSTFCYWTAVAGDMSQKKADELLDNISTDGKRIDSEKIAQLVKRIQPIVTSKGMELTPFGRITFDRKWII